MTKPFLFQFKKPCLSPSRSVSETSYHYDTNLDMVMDVRSIPPIPAIDSTRQPGPVTKKEDIEKGEDSKDRRMWQ